MLYSRKNGGKPFPPFAVVRKEPFLIEIGKNNRTSFSSGEELFLLEEDTGEQFPALPTGLHALSLPHTLPLSMSKERLIKTCVK